MSSEDSVRVVVRVRPLTDTERRHNISETLTCINNEEVAVRRSKSEMTRRWRSMTSPAAKAIDFNFRGASGRLQRSRKSSMSAA